MPGGDNGAVRGRTFDRLRVGAHYVRDGLQITREASGVAIQVLLPRAFRQLRVGGVTTVRASALYLSRAWERSRPGRLAAQRQARDGAASAWRELLAGLARVRDRAGPALARAWHQILVGLARASDLLRQGLAAAWDQYLRRAWNGLTARLRRGGDPVSE